ncbi:helix-turn-helix domain-containing protein [Actinokineospora sp. NBRC 105648]|uniref:PucR family transcriptional regulator n=1 Tax=Actinokineospora sp. NBRC 105648 TaxID=3032206 RepID=UPI0024A3E637|nr:helix-turn-helix domain-containing protein [Actinokineospora sp. NBRC 105648]GLZ43669.1 hypothetical protein Acsp05_72930 [Actinokineospora sp. NBRC 105648]
MGTPTVTSPLPPELRELVKAQLARLPDFARELANLLGTKEQSYRRVDGVELFKVCEVNLRHAFNAFIDGGEVNLGSARKTGRAQARAGIPLSAVLRAFRISGTFTYEALMERAIPPGVITPEQLLPVSATVWRIIDSYSDAIATAYSEVAADSARYDVKARAALLDALLEGRLTRDTEFDDAARALDLSPEGPFVVIVGGTPTALPQDRWRSAWHGQVGIVVVERSADVRALKEALGSAAGGVGVSPPITGLRRLPAALRRARIARRCLAPGETGVITFGDRPLTTLIAGAPNLAAELSREVLAGLMTLTPGERDVLVKTLLAWFDESGSAKDAAERLFVHPNTVRYRIRRIQELTGRDPAHPRDGAELLMAVEVVRLDLVTG